MKQSAYNHIRDTLCSVFDYKVSFNIRWEKNWDDLIKIKRLSKKKLNATIMILCGKMLNFIVYWGWYRYKKISLEQERCLRKLTMPTKLNSIGLPNSVGSRVDIASVETKLSFQDCPSYSIVANLKKSQNEVLPTGNSSITTASLSVIILSFCCQIK